MTINICKDCKDRHEACHATCERYKQRLKEYREERYAISSMYDSARSTRTQMLNRRKYGSFYD